MPTLPRKPPLGPLTTPGASRTRTGDPVYGNGQWYHFARQALWLLGAGATLVAAGPDETDLEPGNSYTFKYYAWPHEQNHYRLWILSLGCNDEDGSRGVVKDITGTTTLATFTVPGHPEPKRSRVLTTCIFTENVANATAGEVGFVIDVDAAAPDNVTLLGACCYELPIVYTGAEAHALNMPDEITLNSRQPIFDNDDTYPASLKAVQRAAKDAIEDARRSCLFSMYRLQQTFVSSATFVPFCDATVPVLARRRYVADSAGNRSIEIAALGEGTGEAKFTAVSGDSLTLAWTGALEWKTGTLNVDAESPAALATTGGLQSGTRDLISVQWRSIVPFTDELALYGFCGGEVD